MNTTIKAELPFVTPSVTEKTFEDQWIYNLSVMVPTTNSGRISIELLPYNSQTREICLGSGMEIVTTDNLWDAVQDVPEVQAAMSIILSAVPALRSWVHQRNLVANQPPPPVVVDELEADEVESRNQPPLVIDEPAPPLVEG